ncbi:MSCRAMM family protein [Clostridium minihomine]|uniref:MSCRAMM family protein n=1 Tax=Clostridium minihomine TaxID=2045012 RepID=UPI000C761811|nr:SpaA isopeptide-forming pilin-related protein [Clostridium minihomine]
MKNWTGKRAIALFLCFLLSFQLLPLTALGAEGEEEGDTGNKEVNLLVEGGKFTTPEMFEAFDLIASVTDKKLTLNFDMKLNDDSEVKASVGEYLESYLEELKLPDPIEEADDFRKAVDDLLTKGALAEDDENFPPITFEFSLKFDKDTFGSLEQLKGTFPLEFDEANAPKGKLKIGEYTIQADGEDTLTIKGSLNKIIYNRDEVAAGGELNVTITKEGDGETQPNLDLEDGIISVNVTFSGGSEPGGGEKDKYQLTKEASAITEADSDHFLTYTIKATAPKEKTLEGMTLVDPIPEGLMVTAVELNEVPLEKDAETGNGKYSYPAASGEEENSSNVLKYTFGEEAKDLTEATFVVTTMMTAEMYQKYLAEKSPSFTFTNQAELWGENSTDPDAVSNKVTSKLSGSFMTKEGKRGELNSPYYNWTIQANTYFTGINGTVYLIDSIQGVKDTHMYEEVSGKVPFTVNGTSGEATKETKSSKYIPYSDLSKLMELTKEQRETVFESLDQLTNDGAKAVYYVNDDKNEAVMIIPLKKDDLNKPLIVTYRTEVKKAITEDTKNVQLQNEATMLWKSGTVEYGPGPGNEWSDDFAFNISKEGTLDYSLFQKSKGSYQENEDGKHHEDARLLTWNFTVNMSSQEITDAVITDILNNKEQQLESINYRILTRTTDLKNRKYGSGWIEIKADTDTSEKPYYTETKNKNDDTTTYQIHLDKILESQVYELQFITRVVDPSILNQNGSKVLENEATFTGEIKEKPVTGKGKAEKKIPNTILEKENVDSEGKQGNYYDYENHQLYWKVKMNRSHASILAGAVLTDTLPDETTFGELKEVTRISSTGVSQKGTIHGTTVTFENGQKVTVKNADPAKGKVTFTVDKEFDDTFEFLFTTVVDDALREKIAKQKDESGVLNPWYSFTNEVKLNGFVQDPTDKDGPGVAIEASASVTHDVNLPSITKTGEYFHMKDYPDYGTVSYAHWTIVLNRDGVNMEGAQLVDDLKSFFQLVPESLKVHKATVSQDGTKVEPEGESISDQTLNMVKLDNKFSFTIPKQYAITPLIVTFDTVLVDNVSKDDMINTVSLKWNKDDSTNTGGSNPGATEDFDLSNYATGAKTPYVQVKKIDSNGKTPLGGAAFTLSTMTKSGEQWVVGNSKVKTTSQETGNANFLFLKRDTLYQIKETKAPEGYALDGRPQYFVFLATTTLADYPQGTKEMKLDSGNFPIIEVENSKTSGTITGKKTDTLNRALPGALIGLFEEGTTEFTKENAKQMMLSNNDGSFEFKEAPGSYLIAEISAPSGYEKNTEAIFTVNVAEDGKMTVIHPAEVTEILIKNEKIPVTPPVTPGKPGKPGGGGGGGKPGNPSDTGFIAIQKSSEDGRLEGFTFVVSDGMSYSQEFVTDQDGRIMIDNLPRGRYTIREKGTALTNGRYQLPGEQTVSLSGSGVKVSFYNELATEWIPPEEVPVSPGTPTAPEPENTEQIDDENPPAGPGKEVYGPKTGYMGISPMWAFVLVLSLAGLGFCVNLLVTNRSEGRHVRK